jgi:hypothetical protein
MNAKMKVLSLALIGAFGYVGAAAAVCPAGPAIADGGAWTSKTVTSAALAIVTPGDAGTECRLAASLNQNASIIAKAQVRDDTPANETRYRARFYIDTTEITGLTALRATQVAIVNGAVAPAGANQYLIKATMFGLGGVPTLRLLVSDASQPGNSRNVDVPLTNASGKNRFEIDLGVSANAELRYWMSADSVATAEANPTGTVTGINNGGWTGVDSTLLGLASASNGYRQAYTVDNHVYFDQFDSRRQTFIGQ